MKTATNSKATETHLFAFDTVTQARGFASEVGVDAPSLDSCITVIGVSCKNDRVFARISNIAAMWRQAVS